MIFTNHDGSSLQTRKQTSNKEDIEIKIVVAVVDTRFFLEQDQLHSISNVDYDTMRKYEDNDNDIYTDQLIKQTFEYRYTYIDIGLELNHYPVITKKNNNVHVRITFSVLIKNMCIYYTYTIDDKNQDSIRQSINQSINILLSSIN
ncbi:hypothetical protein DERP_012963 [Dermatophagoides pteronyssinus]|uniref:Uncharacterized protein n=1 Tax=Dermatophagoides pteronyssinus TaxID=6956 RepID=A0ABQ8ISG3_DERPT|nr:hypothetical protein DERP_012963 [Dermatophagoides pteronyssinus]